MEFLNPNLFYILMVPLIVLFIVLITSKSEIQKYFSKEILEQISVKSTYLSKNTRNILYFVVLILFIVALSRPVLNEKEHTIKQNLIPIVIALDVSTSMLVSDIYPNRISLAKKKLQKIIEKSKNSTIGVLLFAKDSFILSPVTEDFLSLKYIVDNLDTNLNFLNGSNIFSTLDATKYMLEDFKVKNLIILSDGGNSNEYTNELKFAKENDIVIYSIGIATKEGAPIPKKDGYLTNEKGDIVTVKLNESIKHLSLKSGGGYIEYSLDDNDIESIINRINIQSEKEELNSQKIKIYTELFYYPLALGLFFLLIVLSSFPQFRNKSHIHSLVFTSIIISFSFVPTASIAYTFNYENIDKANTAYENKEYAKASEGYRKVSSNNESFYNLANSLYKEKKYDDAIKMYNKVVTSDTELEAKKLHNLGNSYVNKNDLEKAKEFYEKALKIHEDKDTKENLEIVNKELEKQKKKEEKKDKEDTKDQKNQDEKKQSKDSQDDKSKDSQDDKSKDSKDKDKKNQENKKDDTKESKKKDSEKEKQNKEDKKSKDNDEINKDEISQMEEKKWMQLLKNQKTPLYLQEVKTNKESSYDEKQPW